jgi:hypothetical protein
VHRRLRGGVEVLQERRRDLAQLGLHRHQQPQVPHPPPDDVPVAAALQPAERDELGGEPVCRCRRQARTAAQLARGESAVLDVERAEQREDPGRDARAGPGEVSGHAPILPGREPGTPGPCEVHGRTVTARTCRLRRPHRTLGS